MGRYDEQIEIARAILIHATYSNKAYFYDEIHARREAAAAAMGLSRRDWESLQVEIAERVAEVRALEKRLDAGVEFLGLTLWSESDDAARLRRDDPQQHEKLINLWIALLNKYEWSLQELAIRGIPYRYERPGDELDSIRPVVYSLSTPQ